MNAAALPRVETVNASLVVILVCGLMATSVAVAGPLGTIALLAAAVIYAAATLLPGVIFALYLTLAFFKAALQPLLPLDLTVVLAVLVAIQVIPLVRAGSTGLSRKHLALWLALGGVITLGAIYTNDQAAGATEATRWWLLVALPMLAATRIARDPRLIRQFLVTVAAVGLASMIAGMISIDPSTRLEVFGENTIQSGRALLLLPLLVTVFFLSSPRRWVWYALPGIPLGLILSTATGSRGPLLMFAAVVSFSMAEAILRRRHISRVAVLAGAGIALAIAMSALGDVLPGISLERFGSLAAVVSQGETSDTAVQRLALFGLAMDMFAANPILGTGTAAYHEVANGSLGYAGYTYPHNSILQFASELGVVGATLFIGVVAIAATRSVPYSPWWSGIKSLFLFFSLNSLVSGSIYDDRLLWGLLLLMLAAPVEAVQDPRKVRRGGRHRAATARAAQEAPSPSLA